MFGYDETSAEPVGEPVGGPGGGPGGTSGAGECAEIGQVEIGQVEAAVSGVADIEVEGLGGRAVQEILVAVRRLGARLGAVEARLVERVDVARAWAEDDYLTTASWLADSDRTSLDQARADVRVARRLRSMPVTAAALAAGDITVAHARRLAMLNAPDTAEAFAEAEEFLVDQARALRWCDFVKATGYWLRHAREDRDPDPDKGDREHRNVHLSDGLRGTGLLRAELTPVGKAVVGGELRRLEAQMFKADWDAAKELHGDATTVAHLARTPAQRRHDALVEMAKRSATAPADGKRPKPLLSVMVGEDSFRKILELADGTLISPATAAELLDEAVIERVIMDGPSRVLDLGRLRSFVGAARRAVEIVHGRCDGPGCHVPAEQCEIDHIIPFSWGGLTRPDNGRPKCRGHHRLHTRRTGIDIKVGDLHIEFPDPADTS